MLKNVFTIEDALEDVVEELQNLKAKAELTDERLAKLEGAFEVYRNFQELKDVQTRG